MRVCNLTLHRRSAEGISEARIRKALAEPPGRIPRDGISGLRTLAAPEIWRNSAGFGHKCSRRARSRALFANDGAAPNTRVARPEPVGIHRGGKSVEWQRGDLHVCLMCTPAPWSWASNAGALAWLVASRAALITSLSASAVALPLATNARHAGGGRRASGGRSEGRGCGGRRRRKGERARAALVSPGDGDGWGPMLEEARCDGGGGERHDAATMRL